MRVINIDTLEWIQITCKEMADKAILILKPHINDLNWFEAEPVRHGYWNNDGNGTYCSCCKEHLLTISHTQGTYYGEQDYIEEIEPTNYCPNCGAKMDLKE